MEGSSRPDGTYYDATATTAPPRPPLRGVASCDVCVVGAGYAGLWAALELRRHGFSVIVLEADRVGAGASGRNGGHIVTGYSAEIDRIAAVVGQATARILWDMAEEAKTMLAEAVARHAIDCDLRWGYFFAALNARHMRQLAATAEEWQRLYGYDKARLVGAGGVRSVVDSPLYVGGLLDPGGGHLHPLNYALGLARAVEAAGAVIHEGSPVTALDRGAAPLAITPAGRIQARHVVLCTGMARLLPEAAERVLPVTTGMLATAPLGPAGAARLIPGGVAVSDCRAVVDYFRLSADHRLLFGGGASYLGGGDIVAKVRRRLWAVFPQLAGTATQHAWTGEVAITANRLPHLGRLPGNVWFAHGFSGQGVALTGLAGRILAEALAGTEERFDVLARLPHLSFPGGPLRAPLIALAMAWHRLRDLL